MWLSVKRLRPLSEFQNRCKSSLKIVYRIIPGFRYIISILPKMDTVPYRRRRQRPGSLTQLVRDLLPLTPHLIRGGVGVARGLMDMRQMSQALPPSVQSLPVTPQRSQPRRRKRPSKTTQIPKSLGASSVRVRDTEFLGMVKKDLTTFVFNPAPDSLPRLASFEKMYTRYRVINLTVSYLPSTSTYSTDNVTLGVNPGPKLPEVKDAETIMRLKPSFMRPVYQSASIRLTSSTMPQPWLYCSDDTRDGVFIVLYVYATAGSLGHFNVTYDIEFSNPRPFS
nr:hypothetical protein [Leuven Tombus-like virus 3]